MFIHSVFRAGTSCRAAAFTITLLLLGCGRPADPDSRDAGAPSEVRAEQPDVVYSDTLRAVLDRLAPIFAPIEAWRERALAEVRADSGTARADTVFLRLRLEGKAAVQNAAQPFGDRALQAVVYPDGGSAGVLRRERSGQRGEPEPLERARADTIVEWLRARGLWTYRGEGGAYVDLDEQELLDSFGPFVGSDVREFLRMWARDQHDRIAEDASLMVGYDELALRITDMEQYLADHPASPVREPVEARYNWYLWIYLGGLPNTPAFEYRTRLLRDELRGSLERYVAERPSSRTTAVVSEYLAILGRSGFTRSAEVERFLAARREVFESGPFRY